MIGKALRFNKNKIDPTYCSMAGILARSLVFMKNSKEYGGKYPRDNWREGQKASIYMQSIFRHVIAILCGEWLDKESGLPHIYHVAAGADIGIESDLIDAKTFDIKKVDSVDEFYKRYSEQIKQVVSDN